MKKLALLQLLLLPLAALAEGGHDTTAACSCREQSAMEVVVTSCEAGLRDFATRLVGSSYAQSAGHGRLR